jgi:hypothetical protein
MSKVYLGFASDCVRLAGLAEDEVTRDELMNMAREWMAVAMEEEDNERRVPPLSLP